MNFNIGTPASRFDVAPIQKVDAVSNRAGETRSRVKRRWRRTTRKSNAFTREAALAADNSQE
jgi:putative SOS response-associated peptidase YedK